MKFEIKSEVFKVCPNLVVYIPLVFGFDNKRGERESLDLLRNEETRLRERFLSIEELTSDKNISIYFDAFKRFGANPFKTMPTHFALAKRVIEGGEIPNINPAVNIYNALSIKYLTPFGGEDLSSVYGDFVLTVAKGDEHWKGIGQTEGKNPPAGSLIWCDDYDVSTVALNWRQCERTKCCETTTDGYFIMDGFKNENEENIKNAVAEFVEIIRDVCGGEVRVIKLDSENSSVTVDFETKNIEGIVKPVVVNKTTKADSVFRDKIIKSFEYNIGTPEFSIQIELAKVVGQVQNTIQVSQTQDKKFGDLTSSVALSLSKNLGKNPYDFASEIVSKLPPLDFIEKVEVAKPGFINFYLKKDILIRKVLDISENFGDFNEGNGEKIMVEYGQPNTHKSITVGHVKSAITGLSVARLYEAAGYKVIHANYFGDLGPYVAKTIYALVYKVVGDLEVSEISDAVVNESIAYLNGIFEEKGLKGLKAEIGELYVDGSKMSESEEKFGRRIKEINSLLFEMKNPQIEKLYKETRRLCILYQDDFFAKLGVKYDRQYPESEVFDIGKRTVIDNIDKVFIKDQGAVIFPGEKYGLNRWVFLTSDGNPTYSGKDLGLVVLKFKEYPDLKFCLIMTSVEQNEYFKALIKVISLIHPEYENRYFHEGFGWLLFNNKKTSSRGGSITYDEMVDSAIESAKSKITDVKGYSSEEVENISNAIAIAGIKFNILSHEFHKDINYDPDKFTSLTGYSAPYIMYSYTRAVSILQKNTFDLTTFKDIKLESMVELNLAKKLIDFENIVKVSAKNRMTHLLCEYLYELANDFNSFYTISPILNEEDQITKLSRLVLVWKTSMVIKRGLYLLGIDVIDKM